MARPDKVALVEEITEKVKRANAVILTNYKGLNVHQISDLRRRLRQEKFEYKVAKKTLITRAFKAAQVEELEEFLEGPIALAFSFEDALKLVKILFAFSEQNEFFKIKGGLIERKKLGFNEIATLAKLPSKEELIAKLLASLKSPLYQLVNILSTSPRNLVSVLNLIRFRKESEPMPIDNKNEGDVLIS